MTDTGNIIKTQRDAEIIRQLIIISERAVDMETIEAIHKILKIIKQNEETN